MIYSIQPRIIFEETCPTTSNSSVTKDSLKLELNFQTNRTMYKSLIQSHSIKALTISFDFEGDV